MNGEPNLRCDYPGPCDLYAFTVVRYEFYWSSTTYASNPDKAWLVSMVDGEVNHTDKDIGYYVWPVRNGN